MIEKKITCLRMCVFKTSLELRVNGITLLMRLSFGSSKEINQKEY